jgi:hypothetical protein
MKPEHTRSKVIYGNPLLRERIHDPYHVRGKYREPTRCGGCGAVYHEGRWQWLDQAPADAREAHCPACRRIEDRYPAGEIIVSGAFAAAHADELLQLVRNTEKAENREHPLHRIMDIRQDEDVITITTTDVHLPRRIGHALEGAWDGELETHYDEEGWFARVTWRREQ